MIQATFSTRPTRVLCFDLESRPSAFWYGDKTTAQITAFGWKWRGEKAVRVMLLTHDGQFVDEAGVNRSERAAYLRFRHVLGCADIVYGHNIRGFDLPLFQAGLLRLELPPLPSLRTTDTLKDYPKRKDMSASLENLAKQHGLRVSKKHMSIVDWERANRLSDDGIAEAGKRVASDVVLQEMLRDRLLELGPAWLREPRKWRP